jgi:hypothetical protein
MKAEQAARKSHRCSSSLRVFCLVLAGSVLAPGPALAGAKNKPASTPAKNSPAEKPLTGLGKSGDGDKVHVVNERLAEKWKANKLTPSARASDHEFIRRAYLDIIGRIAKPEEIGKFLKNPESTRRAQLIEQLLDSEEYARNWARIWTVWLVTRSGATTRGGEIYHEQMQTWLEEQFAKKNASFKTLVIDLLTATGKTNENGAVNYILANLGEPSPPSKQMEEGKFTMVPLTARTTRLFLGLQTQCAQCHEDKLHKQWEQRHFWSVNAFFRQVDTPRGRPDANNRMAMARVLEVTENPQLNPEGIILYEERNGVLRSTRAVFLDGAKPNGGGTRRQELARFVTESPYFAKAYVNRMWAHFFGRGFTNPVDDFSPENEPSHPQLLDELASAFVHYGYDPRRLIRWMCNSEAYNLSSVANRTNDKPTAEPFFSRMLLKSFTPEQLFESLIVATQAEMFESKEDRKRLRQQWMQNLTANFGDDEGNEVTFNGTVVQALMMMNGRDINSAISSTKKGTVALAVATKRSPKAMLDYLYLAALNRLPTSSESGRILQVSRTAPVKSRDGLGFWQDVFWALLNSNEFILNH